PSVCDTRKLSRSVAVGMRRRLLKIHLLDANRRRQIQREAALLDRLIDSDGLELVARRIARRFDVLDPVGEERLLVDRDLDAANAARDDLALRGQIENV